MGDASVVGGTSHDLPPEETVEILTRRAGHHPVDDVDILKTVVIEIQRVARPRPPAHSGTGGIRRVVESPSTIMQQ